MKKPEKKNKNEGYSDNLTADAYCDGEVDGFNQAYDKLEKYYKELIEIIKFESYARLVGWNKANKKIIKLQKTVKALSRRIGK